MKLVVLAAVLVVTGASPLLKPAEKDWITFKLTYNKSYSSIEEELTRRNIFVLNQKRVISHNEEYKKGLKTFEMGINHFSDMSQDEVNRLHGPEDMDDRIYGDIGADYFQVPEGVELPSSVDWRLKGAVTEVKNQKHCGSCWAFSSIGVLEGQNFRKTGKLVSLSEQNLIDCVVDNHGCNAGRPHRAFDYARTHGVDTEDSYPYKQKNGTCHYDPANVGTTTEVGAYQRVPKGDEYTLMAAVALAGPVLVSIDSKHPSFHGYRRGVYYEEDCSPTETHHSVLVVGYGTTKNGHEYWIVKNSWGRHWGEHGYIRMSRNKGNNCNIAKFPLVPVV